MALKFLGMGFPALEFLGPKFLLLAFPALNFLRFVSAKSSSAVHISFFVGGFVTFVHAARMDYRKHYQIRTSLNFTRYKKQMTSLLLHKMPKID